MLRTTTKRAGPKPRTIPRAAIKRCLNGHRVRSSWRLGDDCPTCEAEHLREQMAEAHRQLALLDKAEFSRRCNTGPTISYLVVSTGVVRRFTIPGGRRHRPSRRRAV